MSKEEKEFKSIVEQGEQWLLKYGIVQPEHHNRVIAELRTNLPEIKNVEYLLDAQSRAISVKLVVSFWQLLLLLVTFKRTKILKKALQIMEDMLYEYKISVKMSLKDYKGEVYEEQINQLNTIDSADILDLDIDLESLQNRQL